MARLAQIALAATLLLPLTARADVDLTDPLGFLWDIDDEDHGEIINGTTDAFDSWPYVCVTTNMSPAGDCTTDEIFDADDVVATLELGGRQVVTTYDTMYGVEVQRKIYVPDTGTQGFVRYLEILRNTEATAVTVKVLVGSVGGANLGSDSSTIVTATSDGSGVVGPDLEWITTDDNGGGDPHLAMVMAAQSSLYSVEAMYQATDDVTWEYEPVVIQPGATVIFAHFLSQQDSAADASAAAVQLSDLYTLTEASYGLTVQELGQILNFGPPDRDEDGLDNPVDNCPDVANPDQLDADGDDVGDVCDLCPGYDDLIDTDYDRVPDDCDPCPLDNPDDTDDDGVCDSDDTCPGYDDTVDPDGDGVPDECDPCPLDNPDDTDDDGICDSDDPCPEDPSDDTDGDGICDTEDVCPFGDDNQDADGDGISDWCDECRDGDDNIDTDADGLPDDCDDCPNDPDPACVPAVDEGGGCGCATGGSPAAWLAPIALLALIHRRRR